MVKSTFLNRLLTGFLCGIFFGGVVHAADAPDTVMCVIEEPQNRVLSRFVVMDFEDDVLHDESWLLSQPLDYGDFFVASKRSDAPELDVLSLAVGEGRNGGNAMLVESTESSWLPGFWVFKSINRGSYAAHYSDENAYMVPWGMRANRLSFWLKLDKGFRKSYGAWEPPRSPFHQNLHVGTYQFDPRRIGPEYPGDGNGVIESDNWHFYHQVFLRHDKADGDWINVIVNQFPQHIRSYSGSMPPNNPTELAGGYWELLTRFYVDHIPYQADPEIPYPVRMWVDDIEFLYVEENPDISVEFQNIPDQPVPGLGAFEVAPGVDRAFSVLFSNTGADQVCGVITDTSHKDFDIVLTDSDSNPVSMDNYCLPFGASQMLTLTIHPQTSMGTGRDEYVGLSFTAHEQIFPNPNIPSDAASVSFSSPYVEQRTEPGSGPHDAVVSGDHFRVMLLDSIDPPANQAPVLDLIADITVNEGDTVLFNPTATDPDNDSLTFSYSDWMTGNSYVTTSGDIGVHTVTVTVSDGALTDSQGVSVTVNATGTTTAPTLSNGTPAGALAAGTTSTTLSLMTNKTATCKYATTPGTPYPSMADTFTTTGGASHSTAITGLTDGGGYSYYVRCIDGTGNQNTTDYLISFSVANTMTPVQLGNYWLFYGDSETSGRSGEVYTKSQATAFEAVWSSTFGAPPRSHINGTGGASLLNASGRYNARSDRDLATFMHFQESGAQAREGQMTAAEFANTFEAFVRKIVAESPYAIISTETAYSFLSDERWVPYNDAMRLKIELLAQEGITVYVAEVDKDIKELVTQTSFYSVVLSDDIHYTGLGNLMIAVSMYDALGFDVTALDLSGVPDSEVSAANKQLVIDIASSGATGSGEPQACTYTYSAWGACQVDGTRTRTIATQMPNGCIANNPITSETCTDAPGVTESIAIIREDCSQSSIPTANCYTSLSAWEAAEQRNLTLSDEIAVAQIEGEWTSPDATGTTISGWTTSAAQYIKIYTTPEARHNGTWGTGYRRSAHLTISENYVRVDGLSIRQQSTGRIYFVYNSSGAGEIHISNSFGWKSSNGGRDVFDVYSVGSLAVKMWNNIGITDSTDGNSEAFFFNDAEITGYCYNCTGIAGNGSAFRDNYGVTTIKNSIGKSLNSNDFTGSFAAVESSISSDASADGWGGANNKINQAVSFINEGNHDYHLAPNDTSALNAGIDLSLDGNILFSTDVDGDVRGDLWDIGADEY